MGKRRIINLFVAVSALFVLLAAAPAYAAQTVVYRVTSSGLSASTSFFESNECDSTYLTIDGIDGSIRLDRQTSVSSVVHGYIDSYDFCTGLSRYAYFDETVADSAFQIDKQLNRATLHTTVTACGWTGSEEACFPVTIDLTWAGYANTYRDKIREQQSTSHYKAMYSYDSTGRAAVVSGSVVFPWQTFAAQNNYGELRVNKSSQMQVFEL